MWKNILYVKICKYENIPPTRTERSGKMGLHDGHRKRRKESFLATGLVGMADHEVLELVLFYAIPRRDTNVIAHRLITEFGSLDAVVNAAPEELPSVESMISENCDAAR